MRVRSLSLSIRASKRLRGWNSYFIFGNFLYAFIKITRITPSISDGVVYSGAPHTELSHIRGTRVASLRFLPSVDREFDVHFNVYGPVKRKLLTRILSRDFSPLVAAEKSKSKR